MGVGGTDSGSAGLQGWGPKSVSGPTCMHSLFFFSFLTNNFNKGMTMVECRRDRCPPVSQSTRAVVTKYRKRGSSLNHRIYFSQAWRLEVQDPGVGGTCSSCGLPPGVPTGLSLCADLGPGLIFLEGLQPYELGITPRISFYPNHLFSRCSIQTRSHSEVPGFRMSRWEFGGTQPQS